MKSTQIIVESLYNYFLKTKKEEAIDLIDEWAAVNSYEKALTEILEPALHKFGEKWASEDEVNLAQGYISGKITENIMEKLIVERDKKKLKGRTEVKGTAVLGNIEDDYHSLGRKMVVNFLRIDGWIVHDLGNDVLAQDFVEKAVAVNASIIGASAMMYTNAKNMIRIREELDSRKLSEKIKFFVGGAIFNLRPDLVEKVKADGTARNAMEAVKLCNQVHSLKK